MRLRLAPQIPFLAIALVLISAAPSPLAETEQSRQVEISKIVLNWQRLVKDEVSRSGVDKSRIVALANQDQAERQYLWTANFPSSKAINAGANAAIWALVNASDKARTKEIRAYIAKVGWFKVSRDGQLVSHAGWLILQHSQDKVLMTRVISEVESRRNGIDMNPHDYALLSDRLALFSGVAQRFGSQAICSSTSPRRIEMYRTVPGNIDESRAKIGWSTLYSETKADLKVGNPCG